MASNTKQTQARRLSKDRKSGRAKKKEREKNGTTKAEEALFGNVLHPK